jgi:hypothetical protein
MQNMLFKLTLLKTPSYLYYISNTTSYYLRIFKWLIKWGRYVGPRPSNWCPFISIPLFCSQLAKVFGNMGNIFVYNGAILVSPSATWIYCKLDIRLNYCIKALINYGHPFVGALRDSLSPRDSREGNFPWGERESPSTPPPPQGGKSQGPRLWLPG